MNPDYRQIRASFTDDTIRVYQAYSDKIADSAVKDQTFLSPPFKLDRMTWIKPSFLWMMYRSGWGKKERFQSRILAIDISRKGFEWALNNSCLSHRPKSIETARDWIDLKKNSPVRIQWDPERNLMLHPQEYRSIQIGLSNEAVKKYVNSWIENIEDITLIVHKIDDMVNSGRLSEARVILPQETIYPLSQQLKTRLSAG